MLIFAHDAQILPLLKLAHSNLCLVMGVAQYKSVTTPLINFLASSGARDCHLSAFFLVFKLSLQKWLVSVLN